MPKKQNNKAKDEHPVVTRKGQDSFSQKASDLMTEFFGSWSFIIFFLVFLGIWMAVNVVAFIHHWDPYPFILLNLILSCVSALQAPIILMSQNRQSELDRVQAKYDYAVNRKAEREIQDMQEDLDEIKKMIRKITPAKKTTKKSSK